jgi:hypothetical protein
MELRRSPQLDGASVRRSEGAQGLRQMLRQGGAGAIAATSELAKGMRAAAGTRHPSAELTWLREEFEPATGIDYSSIFVGPTIRLSIYGPTISTDDAVQITESFLASPEAERYEAGVRYFFEHRVPE